MAEPAGLAFGLTFGITALASLLSDCVELADQIKLARNLGSDSEIVFTRFLTLVYTRLVTCGQHLSSLDELHDGQLTRLLVQRNLLAIKEILQNVDALKRKYGLTLEYPNSSPGASSPSLVEVEAVLRASANNRQRRTNPIKKLTWAVRDKKAFDDLNGVLALHIEGLEILISKARGQSLQQATPRLPYTMSPPALRLLEAAMTPPDVRPVVVDHDEQEIPEHSSECHSYLRNQIKDRARVFQGDVGNIGGKAVHHAYRDNDISGNAKVIQGNATSEALKDFWRD